MYEDPAPLIEKFVFLKEKYGDNSVIVLYEPAIRCQEKKNLRERIQGNNSIHLFDQFQEAFRFVESLSIGFIFIVSNDFDETTVLKNFRSLVYTRGRSMFDFEEETFFKDLFGDNEIKSLEMKAYVFTTPLDFVFLTSPEENEEEVMVMCDIPEMAKEFHQDYVVIWYDPDVCPEKKKILTKEIDIDQENIYTDFEKLFERIYDSDKVQYHLIMTNKVEAETIINKKDELKDSLIGLYIYCDDDDLVKPKSRKVLIEKKLTDLVPKAKQGIRSNSKLVNSFPAFATDFDVSDRSGFYYLHHFLKGLRNFRNRKQAKDDFVNLAKKIYESKKIFEFEKNYDEYKKEEIFKWYTKESPVYKLVNNCLRIATPDSILYCRFVLKDLERAIKEDYQEKSHQYNGVVYRGAYVSQAEWNKLQGNVGKEIEMYGFLSTSKNIKIAKEFLCSDFGNKVFITIIVPPLPEAELNEQGFAKIDKASSFLEAEILFNVRSKFRIVEVGVTKIDDIGKECRHLVLLYGTQILRKYMTNQRPSLSIEFEFPPDIECNICKSKNNLFSFQQKEFAKVCCLRCLAKNSLPEDTPLVAIEGQSDGKIMKNLNGTLLSFNEKIELPFYGYKCKDCSKTGKDRYLTWIDLNGGDLQRQCLECFKTKMKMESHLLIYESHPYSFWIEHQAAWETIQSEYHQTLSHLFEEKDDSTDHYAVYSRAERHDLCVKYQKKILTRFSRKRNKELEKMGGFFDLAENYRNLGQNEKAFDYFQRILKFYEEFFETNDQRILLTLQNLAMLFQSFGKYQSAKEYFTKVINMRISLNHRIDGDLADSYNSLAAVCKILGEYEKALEYNEKALEIFRNKNGENHPDIAMSYHNTASVYLDVRDFEKAKDCYQKALNITESIYGEKHPNTVSSYTNLGVLYSTMGRFQEALKYDLKATDLWILIYGENHQNVANSYSHLGTVYQELLDYPKAQQYYQKALEIKERLSGENGNKISAEVFVGLGSISHDLGEYHKAKDYFFKYSEEMRLTFGEKHIKTALSYNALGMAHARLHEYLEAKELLFKALTIKVSIFGEDHPCHSALFHNIAEISQRLGQHQEALEHFTKTLNLRKRIFGDIHPGVADSYDNCATVLRIQGKYHYAIESCRKALEIREKIIGDMHPDTATSYNNLGAIFYSQGEHQQALDNYLKALKIRLATLGNLHQQVADSYSNSAYAYESLRKYKEALEYFTKSLDVTEALPGEKNLQTKILYDKVGSMYENLKQYKKALDYQKEALNIAQSIYGENHQEVALAHENVGKAFGNLERHEEALEHYKKALDILKTIYGDRHCLTAIGYNNIGSVLRDLEKYHESQEYFRKAMSLLEITLGKTHAYTVDAYQSYAGVCLLMRQHEKALEYFKKTLNIRKAIPGVQSQDNLGEINAIESLLKRLNQS